MKTYFLSVLVSLFLCSSQLVVAQSCSSAQCGSSGSGGCYCDDGCWTYGDCCPNVCTSCGLSSTTHTTNCTANCANGVLTGSQTAHICTFTNLNVGSGERRDIPGVVNGYSYRIELNSCPSGWWYTITGRRSTDNAVVFNQYAFCNIGFNWTANFTGTIRVNIRRANCLGYQGSGSGNSAILQYRQNAPTAGSTTTWLGAVAGADNWNNGLNWDNCIPNIDIHANIPNVGQQPGINTAGAACKTLTIATGRTLSVCSGCLTQFGDP